MRQFSNVRQFSDKCFIYPSFFNAIPFSSSEERGMNKTEAAAHCVVVGETRRNANHSPRAILMDNNSVN